MFIANNPHNKSEMNIEKKLLCFYCCCTKCEKTFISKYLTSSRELLAFLFSLTLIARLSSSPFFTYLSLSLIFYKYFPHYLKGPTITFTKNLDIVFSTKTATLKNLWFEILFFWFECLSPLSKNESERERICANSSNEVDLPSISSTFLRTNFSYVRHFGSFF
jgi:hypothetical protein